MRKGGRLYSAEILHILTSGDALKAPTNKRHGQRVEFERGFPVVIMAIDGTWQRECLMLDASETGAKLSLGQGSLKGLELKEFFLLLSTVGSAFRRCELAWVNGEQFGAQFVQQTKQSAKVRPVRQIGTIDI